MQLKVAIVGCGKIADGHVEEIRKLEDADVVSVCDVEPLMAEQIAIRYGIPSYYGDFREMLENERPDVVHITTPPASHVPLAITAIEADSHVFIEKPLALNYEETLKLIEFAKSSDRKLTVGWGYFFDPPAVALRELMDRGAIGDPVHIESYYGYSLAGVFGKAAVESGDHWVHSLPGKLFQNNLDHALNKVVEFIADETPYVHSFGYRGRSGLYDDVRDDFADELRTIIVGRKTSANITFSCHARPVGHFLRVYGTMRTAHVDFVSRTITVDSGATLPSALGRLTPAFSKSWQYLRNGCKNVFRFARSDFHYFAGLNRLVANFYRSIITDSDPPIKYSDILRVAWLMDRVIEQVDQSRQGGDA